MRRVAHERAHHGHDAPARIPWPPATAETPPDTLPEGNSTRHLERYGHESKDKEVTDRKTPDVTATSSSGPDPQTEKGL